MFATAIVLLAVLLIWQPSAFAHAGLATSSPAAGSVVGEPPGEIVLTFNEAVAVVDMKVLAEDGATVPATLRSEGPVLRLVPSFPSPPDGVYTVRWSIVGEDSHILQGALAFRIGAGPPPVARDVGSLGSDELPKVEPSPAHAALVGSVALRFILVFGLLLGGGAVLFEVLFDRPSHVPVRLIASLALAALAADLALKAALAGFSLAPKFGPAVVAAGLVLMMIAGRKVAAAGALVAAVGLSFWGHAMLGQRLIGQPLEVVHVAAAALWIGSLWPLYHIARQEVAAEPAMRRFSRLAAPVVAALVVAGLALAVLRGVLAGPAAWPAYTVVLAVKLALVIVAVGLALWNRLLLVPRLPGSGGALARNIDLELVLMVLIVLAAAWLAWLPPPSG